MNRIKTTSLAVTLLVFLACQNKKPTHTSQAKTDTLKTVAVAKIIVADHKNDSVELAQLVKNFYKWHATTKLKYEGFKPVRRNPTDSLYTGIYLDENQKSMEELKASGFFNDDFLLQYHTIAEQMDKELKAGASVWPVGELASFDTDADPWCKCQDTPQDDFWNILRFSGFKYNGNEASFKWNWGDDSFYNVKAKKANDVWKISYLEGFDMAFYNWKWNIYHKKQ